MIDRRKALVVAVVLLSIGVGADNPMPAQSNLRGSSNSTNPSSNVVLLNSTDDDAAALVTKSRERKEDLFLARSNDFAFDDDVIAAYESSNDTPWHPNRAPPYTTTPTGAPLSSNVSSSGIQPVSTGVYHQAPSRPAEPNLPSVEPPQANHTTLTSTPSSYSSTAPTMIPSINTIVDSELVTSLAPSPSTSDRGNKVIFPRYHQEDVIVEVNANEQLDDNNASSYSAEQLESSPSTNDSKSKHVVPALLIGCASTILFVALFLVCANQREQYTQRKWVLDKLRRAALTEDCAGSAQSSRAYSDPFDDVYGEDIEDGRSLYSRNSGSKGGECSGSEGGGSYWAQAVVKKLADRTGQPSPNTTNILPPLDAGEDNVSDDDQESFANLSIVSSLTQSLMTFGSALWPSEEVSLNLSPSSRRVAAKSKGTSIASSDKESLDGDDSAIAHLHQTNSNENSNDDNGSVCSSLTDGTGTTRKSADFDVASVGGGSIGTSMPAIDEDAAVHDEGNRRKSGKDISTDSTQTRSTVLDDSSSLDLASELARLQNLIGSIKPGEDFYEHDIVLKSLSDESFDFGVAEGREEI